MMLKQFGNQDTPVDQALPPSIPQQTNSLGGTNTSSEASINLFPNIPMEPPGEGELVHFNSISWVRIARMVPVSRIAVYPEYLESEPWQSIFFEINSYEKEVIGVDSNSPLSEQVRATKEALQEVLVYNHDLLESIFAEANPRDSLMKALRDDTDM